MEILVNLRPFLDELAMKPVDIIDGGVDKFEKLKQSLFSRIEDQFNEQSVGSDAYLREEEYEGAEYVFGALDRQEVLNKANAWNDSIRGEFKRCIAALLLHDVTPLDTTETYAMSKVARELDNIWFPFARHAVLDTTWTHTFETILTHKQEEDIEQNPEYWAIVSVYVK